MPSALVMNGENSEVSSFAAANFDGDRVPLPARLVGPLRLEGRDSINCFLLVMSAGRYRVLLAPAKDVSGDRGLHRILQRFEELGATDDVRGASDNVQAALRARLIPTLISPMGTGWRITIPKEARMLPTDSDSPFVFVLLVAGFVELWFPDTLRQAVSAPLTKSLR